MSDTTTVTYAVDIAKNVFQLHWVDPATTQSRRKKLSRGRLIEFFASLRPARVVMEACGGAHHWARRLGAMGHAVELLPARQVRPFVQGNKDDAADARAIWVAAHHGDIRRVPIKSAQQQAEMSLHRMRAHWISTRTASINSLRGLLYEFGVVLPQGRKVALRVLGEQRAQFDALLPELMRRLVDQHLQALREIEQHVEQLEHELALVQKTSANARRLRQVPGIGLMGATALAAALGDTRGWRNAREFSCSLGLTPRHTGTGGKIRMGRISKRGDPYVRTLLVSGARSLMSLKNPPAWITRLLGRRHSNVVAVAIANRLARIAWALVAREHDYEPRWAPTSSRDAVAA